MFSQDFLLSKSSVDHTVVLRKIVWVVEDFFEDDGIVDHYLLGRERQVMNIQKLNASFDTFNE
jgi:hypothetical protein